MENLKNTKGSQNLRGENAKKIFLLNQVYVTTYPYI